MLLLVVGEIAPRTYGALHPERLALPASWVYAVLVRVLYPLVWLTTALANAVLRLFGVSRTCGAIAVAGHWNARTASRHGPGRSRISECSPPFSICSRSRSKTS